MITGRQEICKVFRAARLKREREIQLRNYSRIFQTRRLASKRRKYAKKRHGERDLTSAEPREKKRTVAAEIKSRDITANDSNPATMPDLLRFLNCSCTPVQAIKSSSIGTHVSSSVSRSFIHPLGQLPASFFPLDGLLSS